MFDRKKDCFRSLQLEQTLQMIHNLNISQQSSALSKKLRMLLQRALTNVGKY